MHKNNIQVINFVYKMIPERGPQTVFKQFLSGAINVLQSIECNLCSAT